MAQDSDNNLYQCKYRRKSRRLWKRDYSLFGWYFITICTWEHRLLFGKVVNTEMSLNKYGQIVEEEWLMSETIRTEIELNDYIVMPNHFHALIGLDFANYNKEETNNNCGVAKRGSRSISSLVSGFKGSVTRKINSLSAVSMQVWQKNYYDHVIRKGDSLQKIKNYINNNPCVWERDKYFRER